MTNLAKFIYPLIRPPAGLGLKVYFRKIYFSNKNRIPQDRPVFLVSNHPTAFLEPVLYATLFEKPIHSLVRGNFFQNYWARLGLESLYMIAIFRMRDGGVSGLRKNAEIFQSCYNLLAEGKYVMMMAEGFTKHQKRLAPLQKGAARIAFGAMLENGLTDLCIVPLGANFTNAEKFRGEVIVEVGQPMEIYPFLAQYQENKAEAIQALTNSISSLMKSTIVHINDEKDDHLFEDIVRIARRQQSNKLIPVKDYSDQRFILEKSVSNWINENSIEELNHIKGICVNYPFHTIRRSDNNIFNIIVLVLLFPFWVLGKIYRFIPFTIARQIVKRKVDQIEFISPIRYGMGMLFIIFWTLIMVFLTIIYFSYQWIWLPFIMLIFVWISVVYEDLYEIVVHTTQWNNLTTEVQQRALEIENSISDLF